MNYGYTGKILKVNLLTEEIEIEEPDDYFYRTYMGGATLGAYYLLRELSPGVDPLSPDNIIIFAPSVLTGAPIPGFSRHAVVSKSPLTGAIADSQAGGFWGPELKFAGYDAIVIKGKANNPVYLWINNGNVEIKPADHLWGKSTGETEEIIRKQIGDRKVRILTIGPAGEKLVKFANILNECKHANGRLGMGAVMGSKNLKAIAVRGTKGIQMKDKETVISMAKYFNREFMNNPSCRALHDFGTAYLLELYNENGEEPTLNFQTGFSEKTRNLYAKVLNEKILLKREGCYACPVRCKGVVKTGPPYNVDPFYGGPEYEALALFGPNCGVDNLEAVAKANQLCNKYGLDTISTGSVIAFAMECYEKGFISKKDVDGVELRFGNEDAMLKMIEAIAKREGVGNLLAEGVRSVSDVWGNETKKFAMHVKGEEVPMHDARVKGMVGFAYAISPIGADHVALEHDPDFDFNAPQLFLDQVRSLGLLKRCKTSGMDYQKLRMAYYLQLHFSFHDCLCICVFTTAPVRVFTMFDLVKITSAITGWEASLWEFMKLGERRLNMFRAFNVREGFDVKDDWLPERFFEPIKSGPRKGAKWERDELRKYRHLYYEMLNWDSQTGIPRKTKLIELDLPWIIDELSKYGKVPA